MEDLVRETSLWRGRSVFVTGGSGLLGSWLLKRLVAAGAEVSCLMRDWVPQSEAVRAGLLDKVRVMRGDICDRRCLERALADSEPSVVIHLAAQTIVTIANREPVSTFESNVQGTWNLLEACRRTGTAKAIVVASSDKAYGSSESLPYTEETPLAGTYPYDVSKSCADLIAKSYAASFGLPVVITRCGNFFGGGDLNWSRLIPGTIRSVLFQERPVIRSDGAYVRDYFYVEEAAAAYVLLAEKLLLRPELAGEAFNFSNEQQLGVRQVVEKILDLMRSQLAPQILGEAVNEIRCQHLCSNKARDLLGWRPLYDLDAALKCTIAWYRDFFADEDKKGLS
jgi:CDP-glucose 4,6-dehydratase